MTDFDNYAVCSIEKLHHYYKMSCCNEDGFTVGSNKNGVSRKPQFCPFCGTRITNIENLKDNND